MTPRAVDSKSVRDYWERHPAGYDELKALESDPEAFLEERDRQTRLLSPNVAEKYRMRLEDLVLSRVLRGHMLVVKGVVHK